MGICGSTTTKNKHSTNQPTYKTGGAKKNPQASYAKNIPKPQFKATENKDYPCYFIGVGKGKIKTILAFDEERLALLEKEVPENMKVALWSALLQVDPDNIFVAGGRYEGGEFGVEVIKDFCVYHPLSNTCDILPPLIDKRSSFPMVHHLGRLYTIGGRNEKPEPDLTLKDCELFDFGSNQWYRLPSLNKSRCNHAALIYRNQIYTFGGYSGHYRRTTTIERLAPNEQYWEIIPLRLFQGVDVFGYFPLSEDQLIMVGGNMAGTLTKGTYLVNMQLGTVRNLKPMTKMRKQLVSCLSYSRKFYVFTDSAEVLADWETGWKEVDIQNLGHFLPDFYKNFNQTVLNPTLYHSESPQ